MVNRKPSLVTEIVWAPINATINETPRKRAAMVMIQMKRNHCRPEGYALPRPLFPFALEKVTCLPHLPRGISACWLHPATKSGCLWSHRNSRSTLSRISSSVFGQKLGRR